jgi:hypothetical protein
MQETYFVLGPKTVMEMLKEGRKTYVSQKR